MGCCFILIVAIIQYAGGQFVKPEPTFKCPVGYTYFAISDAKPYCRIDVTTTSMTLTHSYIQNLCSKRNANMITVETKKTIQDLQRYINSLESPYGIYALNMTQNAEGKIQFIASGKTKVLENYVVDWDAARHIFACTNVAIDNDEKKGFKFFAGTIDPADTVCTQNISAYTKAICETRDSTDMYTKNKECADGYFMTVFDSTPKCIHLHELDLMAGGSTHISNFALNYSEIASYCASVNGSVVSPDVPEELIYMRELASLWMDRSANQDPKAGIVPSAYVYIHSNKTQQGRFLTRRNMNAQNVGKVKELNGTKNCLSFKVQMMQVNESALHNKLRSSVLPKETLYVMDCNISTIRKFAICEKEPTQIHEKALPAAVKAKKQKEVEEEEEVQIVIPTEKPFVPVQQLILKKIVN